MTIPKRIKGVPFKKRETNNSNSNKKRILKKSLKNPITEDIVKKILPELEDQFIIKSSIINNILE